MKKYLIVGLGGFIGAVTRYEVGGWFSVPPSGFPLGTFLINLTGSFALGLFLTLATAGRPALSNEWRLFVATGIIGSYTTFSTFSVESLNLYNGGYILTGLLYSVLSLVGGMLSVWLGFILARRWSVKS